MGRGRCRGDGGRAEGVAQRQNLHTLHEERNLAQDRGVIPSAENLAVWAMLQSALHNILNGLDLSGRV